MQNIVSNMCEKFHYDRLKNDTALGNRKPDNNKNPDNNNSNNNVRMPNHWEPVSGSNRLIITSQMYASYIKKMQKNW